MRTNVLGSSKLNSSRKPSKAPSVGRYDMNQDQARVANSITAIASDLLSPKSIPWYGS